VRTAEDVWKRAIGSMRVQSASINDLLIEESERKYC
jgi:nuclear transport factor 2 (NTF2) superfamily protein